MNDIEEIWSSSLKAALDAPQVEERGELASISSDVRATKWPQAMLVAATVAAVVGATAALSLGGGHRDGSSATETPSSPTSLTAAARPEGYEDILSALTAHDGEAGYGQVISDQADKKLVIYWKGPPPADVQDLIGTSADGTQVELRASSFSSEEIREASADIYARAVQLFGPGVVSSISGSQDLTSLTLNVESRIDLQKLESAAHGIPLRQKVGEKVHLG